MVKEQKGSRWQGKATRVDGWIGAPKCWLEQNHGQHHNLEARSPPCRLTSLCNEHRSSLPSRVAEKHQVGNRVQKRKGSSPLCL